MKIDLNPLLDSFLKNPKYLAFNLFQPIDSFVLGYRNVDIYERRIFECRQQNVEIYGRISLVPMVDYITSKAQVELVSLAIFFNFLTIDITFLPQRRIDIHDSLSLSGTASFFECIFMLFEFTYASK